MNCTIVMYHYVRDLSSSKFPRIKGLEISQFIHQINYIKNFYKIINYSDLLEAIYGGKKLPRNAVLLTFDDGFIDNYKDIFPILLKEKITACFYPIASPIINQTVLDVHKIHFILASSNNVKQLVDEIL